MVLLDLPVKWDRLEPLDLPVMLDLLDLLDLLALQVKTVKTVKMVPNLLNLVIFHLPQPYLLLKP